MSRKRKKRGADEHSAETTIENCAEHLNGVGSELSVAIANYALFRAAARDTELLDRFSVTRGALGFEVVTASLHKECIMALTRIWDQTKGALSIERIVDKICQPQVLGEIKQRRHQDRQENWLPPQAAVLHPDSLPEEIRGAVIVNLKAAAEQKAKQAVDQVNLDVADCRRLITEVTRGTLSSVKTSLENVRKR